MGASLVSAVPSPALAAEAPAKTCELFAFRGSAPQPDQRDVPLDARILVAYEACGSSRATISLWKRGDPVDGIDVYGWSADASWATFKPAKPLDPASSYVAVLETERGASVIAFTTGTALSPPDADAKPSLRVLNAQYASARLMPDGRARAEFTLELIHPKIGPLGAFYLGGPKRIENSSALVTERLALADGRPTVPVLQTIETRPGEPSCFSVLYEDAAGRLSTASEPACTVVPGTPLGDTTKADGASCAAVPSRGLASKSVVAMLGALGLVGALRRRPRRPL